LGRPSVPDVQQIVATSSAETCNASTWAASAARDSGEAALRRLRAQTQDLQRPTFAQFHGALGVIGSLQRTHRQRGAGTREIDDLFQFVAAELHRHRAHDDAEPKGGEVQRGILRDVGQLRDQDVVTTQAKLQQAHCVAVRQVRDVLERQAQRRSADEHVAIRGVEHRELRGRRAHGVVEHVRDAAV
jgi:hypothetical protein